MSVTELVFDGARALASAGLTRADSWMNALTGLGTLRDKLTHNQISPTHALPETTLEALYNDDHLAAKIVDKIPKEATRRGFCLELEGLASDASARSARDIEQRARALRAMASLRQAWMWGRLYGFGAVFLGIDDGQQPDQPLNEQNIRSLRYLAVIGRPQLTVHKRYEDRTSPLYGEPELYQVRRAAGAGSFVATGELVHESRLIAFGGTIGARFYSKTPDGFDDSVLQRVHVDLRDTATAWMSTSHLLTDASQGVLKIKNLLGLVASGGKETLRTRVELLDMARSVCRSLLLDADGESFERVATSFASIPELMDRFMQRTAAAAEMPVTILWGRSPAGMNATGESDMRSWYDTVEDAQADVLLPRLERLLKLVMLAKDGPTRGSVPDTWKIKFNPLWQPTAMEEATRLKTVADTFVALVNGQVMLDTEAALGLAPHFPTINVEVRQRALKAELKRIEEMAGQDPPDPTQQPGRGNPDPNDDEG